MSLTTRVVQIKTIDCQLLKNGYYQKGQKKTDIGEDVEKDDP